jgi:hypothetical protein
LDFKHIFICSFLPFLLLDLQPQCFAMENNWEVFSEPDSFFLRYNLSSDLFLKGQERRGTVTGRWFFIQDPCTATSCIGLVWDHFPGLRALNWKSFHLIGVSFWFSVLCELCLGYKFNLLLAKDGLLPGQALSGLVVMGRRPTGASRPWACYYSGGSLVIICLWELEMGISDPKHIQNLKWIIIETNKGYCTQNGSTCEKHSFLQRVWWTR